MVSPVETANVQAEHVTQNGVVLGGTAVYTRTVSLWQNG